MPGLSEAFLEIAQLARRLGVEKINQLPGCWEHQIDKQWWVAVNAKAEAVTCSHGPDVPRFSAYVECNGWPAGLINPVEGVFAAGAFMNEDSFIDALKAAAKS
jgi:hypothetical protein